ncbi:MAG: hypothetical protein M3155_00790 [Actinomycetota bacterium]|nr:hypothetical protein [Actinomycetota bacterium]
MRTRPRTPLLALLALAALVALTGCGNRKDVITSSETEGPYLDVGGLQYQVQISRQLNARDTEDGAYFVGVPKPDALAPKETWFAVFVRVKNPTSGFVHPAHRFEISDTQGNRYAPVSIGRDNVFAYRATPISPAGVFPPNDSVARTSPIGGALLLYRLTLDTLANRPLTLHIFSDSGAPREADVELDV